MLFRTPGSTFLTGLAIAAALGLYLRPAVLADAIAFQAALSGAPSAPPPRPAILAATPIAPPEPVFVRQGAAVTALVYRAEPDEEPLLPKDAPHPNIIETDLPSPDASLFLPLSWSPETLNNTEPDATEPAGGQIAYTAAEAAYAALDAGALTTAAALLDRAVAAAPTSQLAADLAYTRLRLGQRREAAQAFEAALRLGADSPEAGALWQQEARRLSDPVSVQAYAFLRKDTGSAAFGTAAPGQSQSALLLQVRPDPLARRPLLLVGRLLTAHRGNRAPDFRHSTQATAGVGWVGAPAVHGTVVAERWVRVGADSRNAWALRAHGGHGAGFGPAAGESLWQHWSVYAETAVIGTRRRDLYAGGEARAGIGHALGPQTRATLTGALWAQVQHDDVTRHRVEAGPSLGVETMLGALPVQMRLDYRLALAAPRAAAGSLSFTLATGL